MPALLSSTFAERVLWQAQAPPLDVPRQALPARVDAVVVGGGLAGLSAAREIALRGHSVVVLEKHRIGWGASTRNGGMVIPELKAGPASLERKYGSLGRLLYGEVNEAFDHVESLIAGHGIDCSYERTGQLWLAHAPHAVPALAAMAREHGDELGEPVHFVPRDELDGEIGSTAYHAGVVIERTGGLQPAAFHRGLVGLARDAGAQLIEHVAATSIEPSSRGRHLVVTTRGSTETRHVLVMTNAYADGLVPALRRRVLPVSSFIIATEVLDPALAAAISPRRRMMVDSKNFLFYWRLTPDGRLAFGGRRSLAASTVEQATDFLYEQMVRVHPQLDGTPVEYAWGGNVAVTLDRLPHVGRVPGGWYATGCNGSGVATNTWMGARLGQAMCGDAPVPSFARLPHRPIPLWPLRKAYLPAVGLYLRWQDRGLART